MGRCPLRLPRSLPEVGTAPSDPQPQPRVPPAPSWHPVGTSGWDGGSPGHLQAVRDRCGDRGTSRRAPRPSSAAGGDRAPPWDRAGAHHNWGPRTEGVGITIPSCAPIVGCRAPSPTSHGDRWRWPGEGWGHRQATEPEARGNWGTKTLPERKNPAKGPANRLTPALSVVGNLWICRHLRGPKSQIFIAGTNGSGVPPPPLRGRRLWLHGEANGFPSSPGLRVLPAGSRLSEGDTAARKRGERVCSHRGPGPGRVLWAWSQRAAREGSPPPRPAQHPARTPLQEGECVKITESLRLEKTSKTIKSNHQPITPTPAKPCPQVPHLHGFWTPPATGTPPLPWAAFQDHLYPHVGAGDFSPRASGHVSASTTSQIFPRHLYFWRNNSWKQLNSRARRHLRMQGTAKSGMLLCVGTRERNREGSTGSSHRGCVTPAALHCGFNGQCHRITEL